MSFKLCNERPVDLMHDCPLRNSRLLGGLRGNTRVRVRPISRAHSVTQGTLRVLVVACEVVPAAAAAAVGRAALDEMQPLPAPLQNK